MSIFAKCLNAEVKRFRYVFVLCVEYDRTGDSMIDAHIQNEVNELEEYDREGDRGKRRSGKKICSETKREINVAKYATKDFRIAQTSIECTMHRKIFFSLAFSLPLVGRSAMHVCGTCSLSLSSRAI